MDDNQLALAYQISNQNNMQHAKEERIEQPKAFSDDHPPEHTSIPTIRDMSTMYINRSSIVRPPIQAKNFELKISLIRMIQTSITFSGLPNEDPLDHLDNLVEICDTFKQEGVSSDAVTLRLFPFSLKGKAKAWLNSLPPASIKTWAALVKRFLIKYYPMEKMNKMKGEIFSFKQHKFEIVSEAWERFRALLRKCPYHGMDGWTVLETFYYGLSYSSQIEIDVTSGGSFMARTVDEANKILENMVIATEEYPSERSSGILDVVDTSGVESVQSLGEICEMCGAARSQVRILAEEKKPNLENLVAQLVQSQVQVTQLLTCMVKVDASFQSQLKTLRALENQMGHLVAMVNNRSHGTLPINDIEVNPMGVMKNAMPFY